MEKFYKELLQNLDREISAIEIEMDSSIERLETIIQTIVKSLNELKDFVLSRGFKNEHEEIRFFKYLKPVVLSKLIYYNTVYKIETHRPHGTKPIKKFLSEELRKLKKFFNSNLEFYKYYRTNSSFIDNKLFVRGNHDVKLSLSTSYFESDHNFTTTHDYKVAKIIANDLIQVYIEDKLNDFRKDNQSFEQLSDKLTWTGSKAALTELIYALQSQNVINNGNIEIKMLAKHFESIFNIELGDFYHTYVEIKKRKINRTKFLDKLRDSLNRKIDEQEEQ